MTYISAYFNPPRGKHLETSDWDGTPTWKTDFSSCLFNQFIFPYRVVNPFYYLTGIYNKIYQLPKWAMLIRAESQTCRDQHKRRLSQLALTVRLNCAGQTVPRAFGQ